MTSMVFIPTYLYIKQHTKTGMLYFGKTFAHNPEKYFGSGSYWLNHIKKHGKEHVITLWYCLFPEEQECVDFATSFSLTHDIVNSTKDGKKIWANQVIEDGLGYGAAKGHKPFWNPTEKERKAVGQKIKEHWKNPEYREKMKQRNIDRWSEDAKAKQTTWLKEIYWTDEKRKQHSEKMSRRPASAGWIAFTQADRSDKHKKAISKALTGKTKSPEHCAKLRKPKPLVVSRICDRRLMALGNFMRWSNSQSLDANK